ncbi:hypothetical protein C8J57DRAFT_1449269 [Mycena rebaudengoi]|nr:hypothetical protein C8J57DRAFT_1449269 [Mycena rebaudengoi]
MDTTKKMPARLADIKRDIAAADPNFQENITRAWNEVLEELDKVTKVIATEGSAYIPQIAFSDLGSVSEVQIADIKRKGSVVIKDIVDDAEAISWKTSLEEFVKANPQAEGIPADNKQFFQLYWTKAQVKARAHPNMLAATTWLNTLYHTSTDEKLEGVDLSTPLTYADRFRIRHPGGHWGGFPPHVDGGSIERWEDANFRACFKDILAGDWKKHDPYALEPRLNARTSLYNLPGRSTIFRTFQGWLAIRFLTNLFGYFHSDHFSSNTGPRQGTLKVFPDVRLSNAYIILRPFFRPLVPADSKDVLDAKNWEYDITSPEFQGIYPKADGFGGPHPTPALHPHLLLEESMTSMPPVSPGDAVFWHCDVVHSVETEHIGSEDSAVMYIPAVPLTPQNAKYIAVQKEHFLRGVPPPDFPVATTGVNFVGLSTEEDIEEPIARRAMGLPISVA